MKTNIPSLLFAVFVSFNAAVAATPSGGMTVQASRDLTIRVAIIDNSKRVDSRAFLHDALAASLSASMSRECQTPIQVKVKLTEATRASDDLVSGVYDAAVVIGSSVPQALLKADLSLLKATDAKSRDLNRTFYLLARGDDASLNRILEAAFEQAVNSAGFQDALKGSEKVGSGIASVVR